MFKCSQELFLGSWIMVIKESKKILCCTYQVLFK